MPKQGCLGRPIGVLLGLSILIACGVIVTLILKGQEFGKLFNSVMPPALTRGLRAQVAATSISPTASIATPVESPTAAPPPPRTPDATRAPVPSRTPSPAPQCDAVVTADAINVRSGPGTNYDIRAAARRGDCLLVTARTAAGDWLAVTLADGTVGWVSAGLVELRVTQSRVPVAAQIPPPPAPAPTRSIDDQIAELAKGQHGTLPQPSTSGSAALGGDAEVTIINDTPYVLTVLIGAPSSTTIILEACPTCSTYMVSPSTCQKEGRAQRVVRLKTGSQQVAARVNAANVVPFVGTWDIKPDTRYTDCFFIVTQLR